MSQGLLSDAFLISLIAGAVAAGVPLLLAGLGEQVSEKAGVLNIGIEGMMLFGAYAGFATAFGSGSLWLGFLAGAAAGLVLALLMALFCVRLGLNQIVIGIALTLGADGITALLHHVQFSRTYPRLPRVETLDIPGLSEIPIVGPSLFARHPMVYIAVIMVVALALLFRKTHVGLNLQAAGDKPDALDAAGISVTATRTWSVLFTGAMAGMGGAYMAMIGAGIFVPFMTGGAGLHRHRAGHAGARAADLGADRRLPLRREPLAHHRAAGGRRQRADGRGADAALPHGDDRAGDLRPAREPAGGARPALRARAEVD